MLPSILVFVSRCSGVESYPDAKGILITAIDWEHGLRWMGIHLGKALLFGTALGWLCC